MALLLAGVLHKQGKDKMDGLVSALLGRLGERPSLAGQARCAGLLGAMVRDLRPFNHQPTSPRYLRTMDAVLNTFDADKAYDIDFKVRLATEALGQAGDSRLRRDNWITIEGGGTKRLKPFQIARYPVTVAEYRLFPIGRLQTNGLLITLPYCWSSADACEYPGEGSRVPSLPTGR